MRTASLTLLLLIPALRAQESTALAKTVRPFVERWCSSCHAGSEAEADLDLVTALRTGRRIDPATILAIRDALQDGDMPPEGEPRPPAADVARVLDWARRTLAAVDTTDAGRVTMRRLSRAEYRYTVRDLFGITEDVTRDFPADDLAYGFDNIGDASSVSALHVERYAAAARRIAELAITTEDPSRPARRRFELEDHVGRGSRRLRAAGDVAAFASRGTVTVPVRLPRSGEYLLRIRAAGDQAGDEPVRMGLAVAGRAVRRIDVPNGRRAPASFERRLRLPGGRATIAVSFVNDFYDPKLADRSRRDRNLYVDWIEVVGPLDRVPPPKSHEWLFAVDPGRGTPAERAAPILRRLLLRAWRRPPEGPEIARLAGLVRGVVADGESFAEGVRVALQAALVSPHFLYRVESGDAGAGSAALPLDDYQLASRLSYFLWSSLPDARLLERARERRLRDRTTLRAEARRMLGDRRADALAENFAAQWLELRALSEVTPDPRRFPFSDELRRSMRRETELFFRAVLREGRGVYDLVDADFTFIDATLAAHYGMAAPAPAGFQRVVLGGARRRGLLGHASILTVTSNPTRTSPVKRGKWILENLLDDPVPPPAPGFDSLPPEIDATVAATLRKQLALHRKDPACAVCHDRLDPLGLVLENYDAVGRWRDADHGTPIDASGRLANGRAIAGPADLRRVLRQGNGLVRSLVKKLFVYAVGRDARGRDTVRLERLVAALPAEPTLTDLVLAIIDLEAFRMRSAGK